MKTTHEDVRALVREKASNRGMWQKDYLLLAMQALDEIPSLKLFHKMEIKAVKERFEDAAALYARSIARGRRHRARLFAIIRRYRFEAVLADQAHRKSFVSVLLERVCYALIIAAIIIAGS